MIERLLPFQFIKRSPFYGSYQGMNYRITEMHGELEVCIYPGPYSLACTPDEQKKYKMFEYSEAGYEEAIAYLNEIYTSEEWKTE